MSITIVEEASSLFMQNGSSYGGVCVPRCEALALQMKRSKLWALLDNPEPFSSSKRRKVDNTRDNADSNSARHSVVKPVSAEDEDSDVKIGFYNANFSVATIMRTSVAKPGSAHGGAIDKWLETCKDDVCNAIRDDGLHVICLVGIGPYVTGLGKRLPQWLERYDRNRAIGLLRYIVHDIPGTWDVYAFGSYGVIISESNVKVLVKPKVAQPSASNQFVPRPMVSFEIVHRVAKPGSGLGHEAVLQNRCQVWVVENEGSANVPLTAFARQTIIKFLMKEANDRAIWGGKLNSSIPSLTEAARQREYSAYHDSNERNEQSTTGNTWAVLPSTTGNPEQLALYRSVKVEGFDIPCAKHATFFGVVLLSDAGCVAKPTDPQDVLQNQPEAQQLVQNLATHANQGDDSTTEIVNEMLKFLWWGGNFRRSNPNAVQEGYDRLNAMLQEIKRVRQEYGCRGKVDDKFAFNEKETAEIHNKYKDSLTWMNAEVREKYEEVKGNPYRFVKGTFNVYFNKSWGSKAFFMHMVRFGTASDIAAMISVFGEFKTSPEYKQIVRANAEKNAAERALKSKRDTLRRKSKLDEDDEELKDRYEKTKKEFEDLRRGSSGVSQASWVDPTTTTRRCVSDGSQN